MKKTNKKVYEFGKNAKNTAYVAVNAETTEEKIAKLTNRLEDGMRQWIASGMLCLEPEDLKNGILERINKFAALNVHEYEKAVMNFIDKLNELFVNDPWMTLQLVAYVFFGEEKGEQVYQARLGRSMGAINQLMKKHNNIVVC